MIIGIDFGLRYVGIATSVGELAQPTEVLSVRDVNDTVNQASRLVVKHAAKLIVLGLPQGPLQERVEHFGHALAKQTGVPVHFFDETLSSIEAHKKLLASSKKKTFRKRMHDAAAAAVILQSYLDAQQKR